MTGTANEVMEALKAAGAEVLKGKGGFWIKGEGFITLAQARKRTGIKSEIRIVEPKVVCGDYGMLCAMFHSRSGR